MSSQNNVVGGYFELELPAQKEEVFPGALKYQSARAAFRALLESSPNISRIWMPYYICDTMLSSARLAGKEIKYYPIDGKLAPAKEIFLKSGDLLVYVNYFGVSDINVNYLLGQHDPDKLVIDCSQAFFSGPYDCLATVYSPRKFFGVPDGGILCTQKNIALPAEQDQESLSRTSHLLQRLAFSAEQGYENYKRAEASLKDSKPKRMSRLTGSLLSAVDYLAVKKKRQKNFIALHERLGEFNSLNLNVDNLVAPMCYPFLPSKRIDKQQFIGGKIYLPTYWPEVKNNGGVGEFEKLLADGLLALPCDQRYGESEINKLTLLIESEL